MDKNHTLDEIIGKTFNIFKNNIPSILIFALIYSIIAGIGSLGAMTIVMSNSLFDEASTLLLTETESEIAFEFIKNNLSPIITTIIYLIIFGIIMLILQIYITSSAIHYYYNNLIEKKNKISDSFNAILTKMGDIIFAHLLLFLIIGGITSLYIILISTISFIAPSTPNTLYVLIILAIILFFALFALLSYLTVKFIFIIESIIIRNKNCIESFKYSSKLVKNNWWRTLGYSIVMSLILILISIAISLIAIPISLITETIDNIFLVELISFPVNYISYAAGLLGTIFNIILYYAYEKEKGLWEIEQKKISYHKSSSHN